MMLKHLQLMLPWLIATDNSVQSCIYSTHSEQTRLPARPVLTTACLHYKVQLSTMLIVHECYTQTLLYAAALDAGT